MQLLPGGNRRKVAYDAELAEKLGVNVAIILGRIIWSIEKHMETNDAKFFIEDRWWMYDCLRNFSTYSGLGLKQIKNVFLFLKSKNIVAAKIFTPGGENWYSLNLENLLAEISGSMSPLDEEPPSTKRTPPPSPKGAYPPARNGHPPSPKGTISSLY